MFGRQFQLTDVAELISMTEIAHYYAALPQVSNALYGAVMRSPSFVSSMKRDPCAVLASAKTLRNLLLFNDSLILSIGPWSDPRYLQIKDRELYKIASAARGKVCSMMEKAQGEILNAVASYKSRFLSVEHQCPGTLLMDMAVSSRTTVDVNLSNNSTPLITAQSTVPYRQ